MSGGAVVGWRRGCRGAVGGVLAEAALCAAVSVLLAACRPSGPEVVRIETPYGDIRVALSDSTPLHRDNFLRLAREGAYDGLLIHRVVPGYLIQGGDPDSRAAAPGDYLGDGSPGYTIPAEIGLPHFRGALAAARLGDPVNPERASNGSQFYIVVGRAYTGEMLDRISERTEATFDEGQRARYRREGGAPQLDGRYTVFGHVVSGMATVDGIAGVPRRGGDDRPRADIPIRMVVE